LSRTARLFLVALLCCRPLFAAAETVRAELAEVTIDYHDGSYFGSLSLVVAASPQVAIEVLTDFDHMAEFVPNLRSSRLLGRSGNVFRVAQQGRADFGPFSFAFESERQIELFPEGRIVAHRLAGSPKAMHSEMRVTATPGGTRLDYHLEMLPDHWFPSGIGTHFMRHELAEQLLSMGREMERRQKARSAPPS
jgi:hypothetical protein